MAETAVNMTGVVKLNDASSYLHVRNRPNGTIIGRISHGTTLTITKMDGKWCFATETNGWSHSNYITLTNNQTAEENNTVTISREEQERLAAEEQARLQQAELDRQMALIEADYSQSVIQDQQIIDSLITNNLNGIYGIPYQFMESVDPRLSGSVMGRKYSEKIISKMPLLCITPGRVEFMSNHSKEEQEGILASLIQSTTGHIETDISNIIKQNGRYFTFAFDYNNYFKYVNGLCRVGARFLNIEDVELNIGGKTAKASNFDWGNALNKNFKATLTSQNFIGFYMDSTDSVSETFSNETTQSQLSSTVNGFSDLAREVGFLLGAGAGKTIDLMDPTKEAEVMASIEEISNRYLKGNRILTDIGKNFATIASGGKLLFPEIWADSSFSRSFDINIKLRTPDSDVISWYLNIYIPLCHLIALVAGHQTTSGNGYHSPFLVRAFYKGLFNIDMGIITDMSITKGKEAAWSIDGLPTEIDVSMTIKDLYNMLSIVDGSEPKNFVTNNILMDYIANTCGININQMDIQRSLEIYWILTRNKVTDLPNKVARKIQDVIDTYAMNLFDAAMNKFLI